MANTGQGRSRPNVERLILCLAYIILVILLTALRPIHQDDGWYASYAYELYNQISGTDTFSTWDLEAGEGDSADSGFVFSLYQLPYILMFGTGVFYTEVLVVFTTLAALFGIVRFFQQYVGKPAIYLPLLLLAWPGFWYHFYNRPEMLAVALGFGGLYLLASSRNNIRAWVGVAFAIPFLMFDAHPISVFLVFGYYLWFFATRRDMRLAAIAGGGAGLTLYLAGNWLANGSLGILSGALGIPVWRGDHYIPVFESGISDMARIAVARYQVYAKLLLATLLWIPLILYRASIKAFLSGKWPWVFSCVGFFVLSTLFTEAVSNGFQLYNSIVVFSIIFLLLLFVFAHAPRKRLAYAALLPLVAVLGYTNFNSLGTYRSYAQYIDHFNAEYPSLRRCLARGSRALMRPTFAFTTAHLGGEYEYPIHVLFLMEQHDISFAEAVRRQDYDIVGLDAADKQFLWSDSDERNYWRGNNPYYNTIADVAVDAGEFSAMVTQRVLVPICSFDEISHGHTEFYQVDKARLGAFIATRSAQ